MNPAAAVDILLVEDNPRDIELTMHALKKRNLANLLYLAKDGAEAVDFMLGRGKYAERNACSAPRLVLLDIKLPKLSGLEVLQIIKNDKRTNTIPVVMMASSSEDPDIQTAYKLGANSYVVKPVEFDAFVEAISNLGYYWLLVNQAPALTKRDPLYD